MSLKLRYPQPGMLDKIVQSVDNNHPCVQLLCHDLQQYYNNQKQTEEMKKERALCVELIRNYLNSDSIKNQLDHNVRIRKIVVFGSFPTHCASKNSDLDLCICLEYDEKPRPLPVTILQAVCRDLQHSKNSKLSMFFGDRQITDISFISTAKVPIIRFKINDIHVDMSASFSKSPPRMCLAAKLINGYCQLDNRFAVLAVFLKSWLKSEGNPCDHLRDFPNSYSLTLMLIHVLQWYNILPNLYKTHNDIFNQAKVTWESVDVCDKFKFPLEERIVVKHRRKESSKLTVVQLLQLFAYQYSDESILTQYCFNMKTGSLETRQARDHPVSIVDVYDTKNPARTARSIVDLKGALICMRQFLANPTENMFSRIMRITAEKMYASPEFSQFAPPSRAEEERSVRYHRRTNHSVPIQSPSMYPPFSPQQATNQNQPQVWKNKKTATSNVAAQNVDHVPYPQGQLHPYHNHNYYAQPSMAMAPPPYVPPGGFLFPTPPMPSQPSDRFNGMNMYPDRR